MITWIFDVVERVPKGHEMVTVMAALESPEFAGMVGVGDGVAVEQGLVACEL